MSLGFFSSLKLHFDDLLIRGERENDAPATDAGPPAGLLWDCISSVACPAPSNKNTAQLNNVFLSLVFFFHYDIVEKD